MTQVICTPPETDDVSTEKEYQFTGSDDKVYFYAEITEPRNGQWFLSLRNGEWVLQPFQDGNNMFIQYQYRSNIREDGTTSALLQARKYSSSTKRCISSVRGPVLTKKNIPRRMINKAIWNPVDGRYWKLLYVNSSEHHDGGWTLESRLYSGYFLAYKTVAISDRFTQIVLVQHGDPYWNNRFFQKNQIPGFDDDVICCSCC
ncbi:uncharacterized protein [Amphiura filiformis]|uniref:uncharacterized protein n=1 Tax=Amphiura filiformis TaxID=82378 RepID=UPI003B21B0E0